MGETGLNIFKNPDNEYERLSANRGIYRETKRQFVRHIYNLTLMGWFILMTKNLSGILLQKEESRIRLISRSHSSPGFAT